MSEEIDPLFATHPNDAFFKAVFVDPASAAEFFQMRLPKEVTARIEWATLAMQHSSFVAQDLQQSHSDLLYTVRCSGHEVWLHLLFEHQTTVDTTMPLRLLSYMTQHWLRHVEQHGLPLPPVLAFVLHQGPDRWTVSPQFTQMFALPDDLAVLFAPYLPSFVHGLLDLSQFDAGRGDDQAKMQVILRLMKAARERQLMQFFEWLGKGGAKMALLLEDNLLRLCMVYAWNADDTLDVEQVSRQLLSEPKLNQSAMTTAQMLRQEGHQEGRQEGRQEGQARGLWVGKLQLLQELMGLPVSSQGELDALSLEDLRATFSELEQAYGRQFKGAAGD